MTFGVQGEGLVFIVQHLRHARVRQAQSARPRLFRDVGALPAAASSLTLLATTPIARHGRQTRLPRALRVDPAMVAQVSNGRASLLEKTFAPKIDDARRVSVA
jgi:hypothetical protein